MEHKPELWMPMLQTAEIVAQRYRVTREMQDEYALVSQERTAAAQREGKFDAEIVPLATRMEVTDKQTGATSMKEVTVVKDEGNRPGTTLEALASLPSVTQGTITAGNASQ